MKFEDINLRGYRKLIACILGVVAIAIVSFFDTPNTETAIQYIAGIVVAFCGSNIYKDVTERSEQRLLEITRESNRLARNVIESELEQESRKK